MKAPHVSDWDQSSANFGMTVLEERLKADGGKQMKEEMVSNLSFKAALLRQLRESGVSPEVFKQANEVRRGVAAARDVVARFPLGPPQSANQR